VEAASIVDLTKTELYKIAISNGPLELRYEAARELQARALRSDMITDIVRLYPVKTPTQIAEYLGIPRSTVVNTARSYGLTKFRAVSG
jgi:hypothetical protein